MRLQKFIAHAGICSRRAAEKLIISGRVSVNGRIIRELGFKVIPGVNRVEVDGNQVEFKKENHTYIVLNKPRGVLTTVHDPFSRSTIMDFIKDVPGRLYPVGRLDKESEGLILLTDDGALTQRLLHPGFKVEKSYLVTVSGMPSRKELAELKKGVEIDGRKTLPCKIKIIERKKGAATLLVTLREGKKRQIRNMFKYMGHTVTKLVRIKIGPISLKGLPAGKWRRLTEKEIMGLKKAAGLD